MKKEQKVISPRQFFFIIITFLIGTASIFIPEIVAGRDAWVSTIIATILGFLPLSIIIYLQNKYKGLSIVQYSEKILGKFFGKLFSMFFVLNMFILTTIVIEDLAVLFEIAILPDIPIIIIRFSMMSLAIYAIFSGIESLGRLAELYALPIIFLLLIIPLVSLEEMDFNFLRPVLAEGYTKVIVGSLMSLNFPFTEVTVLAMILPAVQDEKKSTSLYYLGYAIAAFLLLTRTVVGIAVFSAALLGKFQLPVYQILRFATLGEFLNRIEAFFIFIWILSIFTKLLPTFYGVILGLGQLFELKDKNSLIIPVGILVAFISQAMFPSTAYFFYFETAIYPIFNIIINFLYPILLLLVSFFRPGEEEQKD